MGFGQARCPGHGWSPRPRTADPFPNNGHSDLWPATGAAGADNAQPQTLKAGDDDVGGLFRPEGLCDSVRFPPLKGVKAHGFFCLGSLHGGSILLWVFLLFGYCITIKLF